MDGNNTIFQELILKQRKDCNIDRKLTFMDLKRVSKNLTVSIFDVSQCSIWNGYITNKKNSNSCYINFYFRQQKVALHRLLYENFVNNLDSNQYIKFICSCKGRCCNINHMTTVTKEDNDESKKILNREKKLKKDIIVDFD
mgnify:CR=1 FL=1